MRSIWFDMRVPGWVRYLSDLITGVGINGQQAASGKAIQSLLNIKCHSKWGANGCFFSCWFVRGGFIVIANLRKHYCVSNTTEKNSAILRSLSHNKGQEGNRYHTKGVSQVEFCDLWEDCHSLPLLFRYFLAIGWMKRFIISFIREMFLFFVIDWQ